ncbi:MAG TPA: hypothetical protein V6D47_01520 [Oscillatoriaceae cyanobacterium]
MSQSPALPLLSSLPSLMVDAPIPLGWMLWSQRLERLVAEACVDLAQRERRASRLTVSLYLADGRVRRRTLALPRPSDQLQGVMPTALGLLRLLCAEHPGELLRIGVRFANLVEGANQPIRFERYLARRQPHGWARLASLVASVVCLTGL